MNESAAALRPEAAAAVGRSEMEAMEQWLLPAGGESGLAVNWGIPQFSGLPKGEAVFQIDCGIPATGA